MVEDKKFRIWLKSVEPLAFEGVPIQIKNILISFLFKFILFGKEIFLFFMACLSFSLKKGSWKGKIPFFILFNFDESFSITFTLWFL